MTLTLAALSLVLSATAALAEAPDTQARWDAEKLERRVYQQVVAQACEPEPLTSIPTAAQPITSFQPASIERWGVFDGYGAQLNAFTFARRVDDPTTLDQLEHKVKRSRIHGVLSTSLGALALGGGVAMLAMAAQRDDGSTALSTAGAGVSLVGLIGTAGGLRIAIAPRRLHGDVYRAWEPDRADELIDAHNQALRQELGLAED